MDLDKKSLDFGLFTNNPEAMHKFYGDQLGLKLEGTVPMGPKFKLSRYQLNGSTLKLWHAADPLPPRAPAGFKSLTIADSNTSAPRTVTDPDGSRLVFVPPGHNQVDQIEFQLGVSDVAAAEHFYVDALGAERISAGRCRFGQSVLSFAADSSARPVKTEALSSPLDALAAMAGLGITYLTIQVRDCGAEYQRLPKGLNPGVAFNVPGGPLLGLFMVRDPDGNWVEVLQRK